MRDGEEGQIAFFGDEFRLGLDEDDVGSRQAIEERIQIAEPLARFGAGGGGGGDSFMFGWPVSRRANSIPV